MGTMNSYVKDILDKHSGVQIISEAKVGSRTQYLATDGVFASGTPYTPWPTHYYTTISTAYGSDTSTVNKLSTSYNIFHLGTAAQYYTLPDPYPGMNIKVIVQRSSDVILKSCIGSGDGTPTIGISALSTFATIRTTAASGAYMLEFLALSTSVWQYMGETTANPVIAVATSS